MFAEDNAADEAEHEIQNALMMAAEADQPCDLEGRYSALTLAEEIAAEYGLTYVLPKYCTLCLQTSAAAFLVFNKLSLSCIGHQISSALVISHASDMNQ